MLPQQLSRQASAPPPRSLPQRGSAQAPMDEGDDVLASRLSQKLSLASPSASAPQGTILNGQSRSRPSSQRDRKASDSVAQHQKPSFPPPATFTPDNLSLAPEERVLREAIQKSMHRGGSLESGKHYYSFLNALTTATSGGEFGYILNNMAVGAAYNNRVGPQVRLKHLKMRCVVAKWHDNAAFTDTDVTPPLFRFVLKLTHVPYTPGTAEVVFATDANPPGTGVSLFSGLGINPSTVYGALACSVFNPTSVGSYRLLAEQTVPQMKLHKGSTEAMQQAPWTTLATGETYSNPVHYETWEWDIPLHDVLCTYTTAGGINPITNALEWTCMPQFDAFVSTSFSFSSDLLFEDVNVM